MEKIERADARLKLVKVADEVAHALERLHLAVSRAHDDDVRVVCESFPCVPWVAKKGEPARIDVQTFARGVMLWAAHLHDSDKFEQLGTRRFPDKQRG